MSPKGAPNPTFGPTVRKEQAARAYSLWCTRHTFPEIAAELGVSVGTAHSRVKAGQDLYHIPRVEEARARDVELIDAAVAAIWPKVRKGDSIALNALRGILNRRAKLLGLDVPLQVNHEHSGSVAYTGPVDVELAALAVELGLNDPSPVSGAVAQ